MSLAPSVSAYKHPSLMERCKELGKNKCSELTVIEILRNCGLVFRQWHTKSNIMKNIFMCFGGTYQVTNLEVHIDG